MRLKKIVVLTLSIFALAGTLDITTIHAGDTEKAVAAQCYKDSGNQFAIWAFCAIGKISLNEATKCLTGGDCFGDSNTLVIWNQWVNKQWLNNCGFRSATAKIPSLLVMNNTNFPVTYAVGSEKTNLKQSTLSPHSIELWELDWCDEWGNVLHDILQGGPSGSGNPHENFTYHAGAVMEFAMGIDGRIHQFSITPVR